MDALVGRLNRPTLHEVRAAIAFDQPKLRAAADDRGIVVRGTYLVHGNGALPDPAGPLTAFEVEIIVSDLYPEQEPKVYEVGGRIERCSDRHINLGGDCCVTVWEHWLITASDHSFVAFLRGPVNEFFLGQYWYETTGEWPFGDWSHGSPGLLEAYAEALDIPKDLVIDHLMLLSKDRLKGHWWCPCGSGKRLRYCHVDQLMDLHRRVTPRMVERMLCRLLSDSGQVRQP